MRLKAVLVNAMAENEVLAYMCYSRANNQISCCAVNIDRHPDGDMLTLQVPFDEMFGKDKNPLVFGPFNPNAELRNGRAAMLGLMALLFIEGTSNSAFFM
jgi:hypothetical protein